MTTKRSKFRHTVTIVDALGITSHKHFRWIDAAESYAAQWDSMPGITADISQFEAV